MAQVVGEVVAEEAMEALGETIVTFPGWGEFASGVTSALFTGELIQRANSAGLTTTKGPKGKFVQRTSEDGVVKYYYEGDKSSDSLSPNERFGCLKAGSVSTKIPLDKKLSQMAKAFGINVKNTASDIWKAVKKSWEKTMSIQAETEGETLDWLDITKTGDTAKTTAKKKEFDALKDALYENGVLGETAGTSLMSGTWTSPATLNTVFPFKGDVATHIIDFYLNNYVQFSEEDATTIRNRINDYLTQHPDEGIFSIMPATTAYLGFYVLFASKNKDYNIKITGKPESGSAFLFGDIVYKSQIAIHQIHVNADLDGVSWDPAPADPNYIYGYKVKLKDIKESDLVPLASDIFYRYSGGAQYVAPVFENGTLMDKYKTLDGAEHKMSNATSDELSYNVMIGFDGSHISTITREKINESTQSGYWSYSLAPITISTTIGGLTQYIGKTINEIIKEEGTSVFGPPIVSFSYGMQASAIVGLSDNVNFEKTDENAELPKKNVDIMDQYDDTWAKNATTVGDTYIQDGTLVNSQETVLPFPMDATATQTMAQAGTDVWDYALNQPLAGAQTVAASVPATAPAAITDALVAPAIVPMIPMAIVLPEVLSGGSGAGLWQMYSPSASNISSFGKWLWENPAEGLTSPGDTLKKLFQNPMDAIISLHRVYVTPSTGASKNIQVGFLDSGVSAPVITNRYVQKNMGSVTIKPINGNFMDYEGVDMTIYLPFIGMRGLDTSVCMGATLTLTYNVDVLTGTCVAMLTVNKNNIKGVVYQWVGSMFESVPVTSANMNSAIQGTLGLVGSAVTTVAGAVAGGPAGLIAGGAIGMAQSATNIHTNIQSCGSIGGTAGALASRSAYITLTITQTYNPYNWKNIKGLPDNITTSIGSQHGYIEGSNPTGYSGSMTQAEFNEFEALLEKGIYV